MPELELEWEETASGEPVTYELRQGGLLTVSPIDDDIGGRPGCLYVVFPGDQCVSLTVPEVALLLFKLKDCFKRSTAEAAE